MSLLNEQQKAEYEKEFCNYDITNLDLDISFATPRKILEWMEAQQVSVEPGVKPVDYGTCENCIFNLEESETSLASECQLTIDEFTGIGVMFSREFGCNQWQSKPSV